jgi:hypothetical protein
MKRWQQPFLLCTALALCLASAAADDPAPEPPPPPPIRLTYDVADLVHVSQVDPGTTAVVPPTEVDISTAQQNNRGMGTRGQQRDVTIAEHMDALIKLIQSTIDPTMWRDAGGSEGQISAFETRLIITAPEKDHDQIVALLADLRKQTDRSVRLTATWAALTNDELRSVIIPPAEKDKETARIVDLKAIENIKGAIHERAEINTLSNQRVNITAGRARSVMSSMDAVVGNASAAMQPTIDLVLAGAALQVTPVLSGDGKTVLLDLRAVVSRWDAPDAPPMKLPNPVASTQSSTPTPSAPPAATSTEIDRLNMPVHHLTTAMRMPTGKAVLIGGMTTDTYDKQPRQLYLIMEVVGGK